MRGIIPRKFNLTGGEIVNYSKLNIDILKEYLRLDSDDDNKLLEMILIASKGFVKSYTGLDETALESIEEITVAILALSAEMYDNRQFTVDKDNINPVIKTILGMHSVNLL